MQRRVTFDAPLHQYRPEAADGSGVEAAEVLAQARPAQVSGLLHDAGGLGVSGKGRPARLVPVEDGPDPVFLDRVPVDRRALRAMRSALVGTLAAEDLQEVVEVLPL